LKLIGKIIIGVAVFIVVVGIIGVALGLGGDDQSSTSENTTAEVSKPEPTNKPTKEQKQSQTVISVVAEEFIEEFDKNQLAAEEKYEGKLIEFTAKIKNISEDILGSPFLSLEPESADEFYFGTTIQCFFENKSDLINLENGQIATLRGKVDTQSLGIIIVKDCYVIE